MEVNTYLPVYITKPGWMKLQLYLDEEFPGPFYNIVANVMGPVLRGAGELHMLWKVPPDIITTYLPLEKT